MTRSILIDTHAHLDDPAFDHDREAVVSQVAAAGVRRVINVGYRPERWRTTVALTQCYPLARHMLGMHPQHADEWSTTTRAELLDLLRTTSPVAIGEIGLDYFRPGPDPGMQLTVFEAQLALGTELQMPVVIHQRAAEADLISVLSRPEVPSQVLLHSFEGTNRLAELVNDRGFYVGVGGLASRAGSATLRQTLGAISLERVVLETDSPYLAPAGIRDRRNTPANIALIAERLAPIWDVGLTEFAATTTRNAERLFGPLVDDGRRGPTESSA